MQPTKPLILTLLAVLSAVPALAQYYDSEFDLDIYARDAYPDAYAEAYAEAEADADAEADAEAELELLDDLHPRDAYVEGFEAGLYAREAVQSPVKKAPATKKGNTVKPKAGGAKGHSAKGGAKGHSAKGGAKGHSAKGGAKGHSAKGGAKGHSAKGHSAKGHSAKGGKGAKGGKKPTALQRAKGASAREGKNIAGLDKQEAHLQQELAHDESQVGKDQLAQTQDNQQAKVLEAEQTLSKAAKRGLFDFNLFDDEY